MKHFNFTFKIVDYFFKIVSWELLFAGTSYGAEKLHSSPLFLLAFFMSCAIGAVLMSLVPSILINYPFKDNDKRRIADTSFWMRLVVFSVLIAYINYRMQLELTNWLKIK